MAERGSEETPPQWVLDAVAEMKEGMYEDLIRSAQAGDVYDAVLLIDSLASFLEKPDRPIPASLRRYFSEALSRAADSYLERCDAIARELIEEDANLLDEGQRSTYKRAKERLGDGERGVIEKLSHALNLVHSKPGRPSRRRFLERLVYFKVVSEHSELVSRPGFDLPLEETLEEAIHNTADGLGASPRTIRRLIKPFPDALLPRIDP